MPIIGSLPTSAVAVCTWNSRIAGSPGPGRKQNAGRLQREDVFDAAGRRHGRDPAAAPAQIAQDVVLQALVEHDDVRRVAVEFVGAAQGSRRAVPEVGFVGSDRDEVLRVVVGKLDQPLACFLRLGDGDDHALHHALVTDPARDRASVDAGDAWDSSRNQVVVQAHAPARVRR